MASIITNLTREDAESWYEVLWSDGLSARFPYVFLLDNCRCPSCYFPPANQRATLMTNIDPDVEPVDQDIVEDGKAIHITWPTGHVSMHPAEWLKRHYFGKKPYDPLTSLQMVSWGSEKEKDIPSFLWKDVMEDDRTLYDWLVKLLTDGFTLIRETPGEKGVLGSLHKRVAWTKQSIYGDNFNVITAYATDAGDLINTGSELGLHNDLPSLYYTPGIHALHCIRQAKLNGGDSLFTDGLRVAEQIRNENPKIFETLTNMDVDFRTVGVFEGRYEYHAMSQKKIIECDRDGNFQGINWSDFGRAPYWSLPVEDVKEGYRALKVFHNAIYDEGNIITYKLKKGEMAVFNNRRVMHGRKSFTVEKPDGEDKIVRQLEGGYMDWDGVKSKMRLLYEQIFGLQRF